MYFSPAMRVTTGSLQMMFSSQFRAGEPLQLPDAVLGKLRWSRAQ
jgi:hypothetical protein